MDDSSNGYHISFFKPTTPQALANRNMVIWLLLIWTIAIFGFQILLRVIEKPTPEPAYLSFQNVWENVEHGNASPIEMQEFGHATLSVLGKIAITDAEKTTLDNALSWSLHQLVPDSLKNNMVSKIQNFEQIKNSIENIADPAYLKLKSDLTNEFSPILGLLPLDIRAKILPLELNSLNINNLTEETKNSLPGIMEKYLIHNQSILTDTKFLGFPFHYFYSAVFLLILFIGLCWLYCVKTDSLNAKLNLAD